MQDCSLCVLRGGALKPTTTGRWAHLVCAVSIPEVLLQDAVCKEPVITTDIPRSRKKLVCVYQSSVILMSCHLSPSQRCSMCLSVQAGMTRGLGVCVQCVRERCYTSFHVTCAQYRGLLSEDCKDRCGLICHKHFLTQVSLPPHQLSLPLTSNALSSLCCRRSRKGWR